MILVILMILKIISNASYGSKQTSRITQSFCGALWLRFRSPYLLGIR